MVELHQLIARMLVLYYALVGLWGVALGIGRRPVDGGYRGALILAGGLAVVQALVGLVLLASGLRPRDDLHYLYGLSVIVALPLVHQYLAGRRVPAALVYGLACLFMVGLALRGITTGSP
jgi:hypothetical protein